MMRMIDVECNIIESNKISGIDGRTLRCIVENVSDGFTEVDESKQDICTCRVARIRIY